ncbi:MAG: hypothetical protein AAGE52_08015 [Myxococcota bacterium]
MDPFRHPTKPASVVAREEADEAIDAAIAAASSDRIERRAAAEKRVRWIRRFAIGLFLAVPAGALLTYHTGHVEASGLVCMVGGMGWLFVMIGYLTARITPSDSSNNPPSSYRSGLP